MKTTLALGLSLVTLTGGVGCGGDDSSGPLGNVDSLIILQRPKRNDMGDIFQYTSYVPKTPAGANARLVKLEPPTADGTQTTICCDNIPGFENVDISGYDISFDAKQIVFAGKLSANTKYGLFLLTLSDGSVEQIPTDPGRDYNSPIFLPGDKIMFTTNAIVEPGAPQHVDEYERGTTLQLGRIGTDGSGEELGPRNLSHRTFPTLVSDGRVMFTQWDHLGTANAGHLMFANQDMQALREGFGKEGTSPSNSTLKAQEIAPGRFVAIATSRNRTIQAGALLDIRLGEVVTTDGDVTAAEKQTEQNATYKELTPGVPMDMTPSAETVGRYYDAFPLNAKAKPDLVVSWADGPVESGVLGSAGLEANFGVFLLDTANNQRRPILDDPAMWDIFPRPLQTRTAPPVTGSATDTNLGGKTMIGSMDVYKSSLKTFDAGSIYGVRVSEGFSSEEGFPEMFGTTMFEGMATLGVAPVRADGSWLATVPANVPLRVQTIDKFGLASFSEPVWFSGRAGESRVCGGCHESRSETVNINPGVTDAFQIGPTPMYGDVVRENRKSMTDFSRDKIMGVAWNKVLQPMFDAKCISCHNGTPGAANPSYTVTDPMTGTAVTWTFDLRGTQIPAAFAELGGDPAFTASYLSMAGLDMQAIEEGDLMVSGTYKVYLNPEDARGSLAITKLNPPQQFPTQNASVRAFPGAGHMAAVGGPDLTPDEYYALILAADNGVSFYARENNPGLDRY
ncbi:MAG: hypothetical protein JWP01_4083 [Myxococcales bacterium]|nr:hypothetical protein [Myxococcales bacterium]